MTPEDINNRFDYHPPASSVKQTQHEEIRAACKGLAQQLNNQLPEGREKSTAITKLEEAMFWSNAALAREA